MKKKHIYWYNFYTYDHFLFICNYVEENMNISQSTKQKIAQNQILSQKQQQSLKILSMTNDELRDFIENEHMENPMLEISNYSNNYENADSVYLNIAAPQKNSLKSYLQSQISTKEFNSMELSFINTIIEMIDESTGFLSFDLKNIVAKFPQYKDLIIKCLNVVQSLEPIGIGARNIVESLLLQADTKGFLDENLTLIIKNHLQNIADGKISSISRDLKLSTTQVRNYIKLIRMLNPRPAQGFSNTSTEYIVPDVLLSFDGEKWNITLNDNWLGSININATYEKIARQSTDEILVSYFKEKLERARLITKSIEQRRSTLLNVTKSILNHQIEFITSTGSLKPLILEDISKELDIHLSTVSRTIKNKYIQTPRGTFPFKKFFTSTISTTSTNITSEFVKDKIKQIIKSELKNKPYSDNKISNILYDQNIEISRRTVAKYREEIGIPSTIERKETI